MAGMAASASADSVGLVTNIMVSAPQQHDGVAQRLAQRGASRTLDLRGVGGEAAHHLAGVRRLVEGRARAR